MTSEQIKAARALLGWSQLQLGLRSDTSIHVVRTFERTGRIMTVRRRPDLTDPLTAIRAALEQAGVEFTNKDTLGVRLRKPDR